MRPRLRRAHLVVERQQLGAPLVDELHKGVAEYVKCPLPRHRAARTTDVKQLSASCRTMLGPASFGQHLTDN